MGRDNWLSGARKRLEERAETDEVLADILEHCRGYQSSHSPETDIGSTPQREREMLQKVRGAPGRNARAWKRGW